VVVNFSKQLIWKHEKEIRHFIFGLVWEVQMEERVDIFQSKTDPFVQLR
jgi:hypothetical protein